ncbi:hypothetical protein J6590_103370 [Homalodisca vitripennis]|nr:hypothetical protein J6590_103370 [Homalodisca vitripennis]
MRQGRRRVTRGHVVTVRWFATPRQLRHPRLIVDSSGRCELKVLYETGPDLAGDEGACGHCPVVHLAIMPPRLIVDSSGRCDLKLRHLRLIVDFSGRCELKVFIETGPDLAGDEGACGPCPVVRQLVAKLVYANHAYLVQIIVGFSGRVEFKESTSKGFYSMREYFCHLKIWCKSIIFHSLPWGGEKSSEGSPANPLEFLSSTLVGVEAIEAARLNHQRSA